MLKALQQTVRVGAGGKIELVAPECPEGSDVQVIVLLTPQIQTVDLEQLESSGLDIGERPEPDAIAKVQAIVRRYVPEGKSLVDELIADRRAEAERE
ncbi:MAG: hypothetical protein WBA99_05390 [Nodosilinea sp.]